MDQDDEGKEMEGGGIEVMNMKGCGRVDGDEDGIRDEKRSN